MAAAREDAVTNTRITGWPCFHPESDAIRDMECALDALLRSHRRVRSRRVKGSGYGTRHATYSPNCAPYLRGQKTLWNATSSVIADLFQFLKEFHSVLALETAVHEATLNRLGKFGQPEGSNTKVIFRVFLVALLLINTYNAVGADAADDSRTNANGSVDNTA